MEKTAPGGEKMSLKKLKRGIEKMPRGAYVFLRAVLALAAAMLAASCALYAAGDHPHLAEALLQTPAGVLLLGAVGLAIMLDHGV